MTRDESTWVNDLFAAGARDCTPPLARDACVLFAPVMHDAEVARRCAAILSADELRKADSFLAVEHKAHFKQQRAFRRFCGARALGSCLPLSQIEFIETEKGRPYLPWAPDICFSFSSCRSGFLGAWSWSQDIGIDIEHRTGKVAAEELAQCYFTHAEARTVATATDASRTSTFYRLWTLKEAALKSIGEGLPFGLERFEFELMPNLRIVDAPREHDGPRRFRAHVIDGRDHCAALVTAQRVCA